MLAFRNRWCGLLGLGVLAAMLGVSGMADEPKAVGVAPATLRMATVTRGTLVITVNATGTVEQIRLNATMTQNVVTYTAVVATDNPGENLLSYLTANVSEGTRFTSFYTAPVCTPSRAQMLTGCYAKRVGLPNVLFPAAAIGINASEHTLAELLRQQGYATMCVGKWHLGDQPEFLPTRHGFDHYLGLPYSSDMGPSRAVNAPLRGFKGSTWEGGVRDPMIAWWPGKVPAGSNCDAVTTEMDVLPTLVNLAGGQVPADHGIDGKDLWPLLSGQSKESPHDAVYYFQGNVLQAVRSGPWKPALGEPAGGRGKKQAKAAKGERPITSPRLYNLESDIGETTDRAGENPVVVQRLQALVAAVDRDMGTGNQPGPGTRPPGRVDHPDLSCRSRRKDPGPSQHPRRRRPSIPCVLGIASLGTPPRRLPDEP